ncbi:GTPase 1 Interferon-induced very large [Triplophysa tibetana]|uniref:GTPase 1 Interferon-induced very large n=1 Tax=Triplophysa tibetana TaxID=1572043 RepID=A0A5A9NB30_9TELE|nr:GTPase 1 Interferon-induced very large [Triplophysa tibetana]
MEIEEMKKDLQIKFDTQIDKQMNTVENELRDHERERKRREEERQMRIESKKCEGQRQDVRKEKDEKEKDQPEEFESVQEEGNVREEQRKNLEDKLKLMEEENEDELNKRTTELRDKNDGEKEKICSQSQALVQRVNKNIATAGVQPDQLLQEKIKREKTEYLFHRLHLKRNSNSLRAADVLQITVHSLQSHESCAEEELVTNYLQKLLMMNYRARDIQTKGKNEHHHTLQGGRGLSDCKAFFCDEIHLFSKGPDPIHPMDVQMAVFHCADSFLKQMMVTKLSQCQFALPLLVPHPFTQHIDFPLWTFRQINKSWKIRKTDDDIISKVQSVCTAETPMVSFFRFGSVSSSKSQLMNSLINEKHNTFFTRNCPGSSRTRLLMDGVVEISWYCPSGKDTDTFTDCVAFCNLHGDAGDNETQMKILTEMSSVNVVLLTKLDKNDKNATKIQELYSDPKPLILLLTEEESAVIEMRKEKKYKIGLKDRNQSDVSEDLRRATHDCLSSSASEGFMFRLEDVSKYSDIRVDEEDDEDCRRGREAAQEMMSLLKNKPLTEIKESFLPHQGELWHQWCQKNKELHRAQTTERDISRKQTEMKIIREDQNKIQIKTFIKFFITQMNSHNTNVNICFLKWLRILLDEFSTADLSALHNIYDQKCSTVLKLKEYINSEQLKDAQTELERISADLQAASFGLEHIVREISQIYESCSSVKKNKTDLQFNFSSLPSIAAEMMMSGFPLELMDGDAAHVPVMWVTAVLDDLILKLGDQRVFVLSVLGLQSSGKSTMLNAMFGLEFAVSAGRCTRGAFMQLIRVSEEMKQQMKFDYILVVDTDGLCSPELAGKSTRHHDNELATFVVGLGHLTLINIFGKNLSGMQGILQIVVQAFLRMKKVKLNPSCMFIHQNVSDVTAGEKNERRLQWILHEMTKLASKDEDSCFGDVVDFDVKNDMKYFAQLWDGNPPMAPPNPNYLFRNSLEISVYRRLETEYNKWSWTLRSAMLEIENKLQNRIENEAICEIDEPDLHTELKQKSDEVNKSMSEFFEKDTDADILIQWKVSFELKIRDIHENIVRETKRNLNESLQQRDLKRKLDAQKTHHENTLLEKSKELALNLKDKANDEETLKREFDVFWEESVKKITADSPPIKDINILRDVKKLLMDFYEEFKCNDIRDIFKVQSYAGCVKLKKSRGFAAHVMNVYETAKQSLSHSLPQENEIQIKAFVHDIAKQIDTMIQSFNISKQGYNASYIQKLSDHIKKRITEYEEQSLKYVFKDEFFIDLVFSIFKRANKTLTDQHREFMENNDPVLYIKRKREECYSIFQKYCQGATSAAIFGEIICQKLKEPTEQSVYRQTARDLADDMKSNCPSLRGNRSNLEKHILKRLAEEENFDKYMDYIKNPRDHFKSFIRAEVSQYIRDQFSVQLKMKQNIELLQEKIMTAAHESTQHVQENRGNVDVWLKFFTLKLSDDLMFSVKDFSGMNQDDDDVDFDLLEDVIRKELQSITSDISREFSTDLFDVKLDVNNRADEIVINHFCKCCWVQCPFCGATCTNTIENHDEDHSVPLHRVDGFNGKYFGGNLCIDICTSELFNFNDFETDIFWSQYRTLPGDYEKWSITPDFTELPYWKWVLCRFQKDLERYYKKTFRESNIPFEWRRYTKQEAFESLDKYI